MIDINRIYHGSALDVLKTWPDEIIDCVITSPPYWGLRNYSACFCIVGKSSGGKNYSLREPDKDCDLCGGSGIDMFVKKYQLGLEKSPDEYVSKLIEICAEIKRVLRPDGTLWLNLGDSYWGSNGFHSNFKSSGLHKNVIGSGSGGTVRSGKNDSGLKRKDLVGIPWRVAFGLQTDGWYLRQDIIWNKPNCMPENLDDRFTKSHEYIFLLSKNPNYYFDSFSVKEDSVDPESLGGRRRRNPDSRMKSGDKLLMQNLWNREGKIYLKRNKRSVWAITTAKFRGSDYGMGHFATFPEKLIEIPIKAGSREGGLVLDPFMGAGTTAVVAKKLNRNFVGIELNQKYINLAYTRIDREVGLLLPS